MEQYANALKVTVLADLDRASADTIVKRVGRRLGVVGGQCVRNGDSFDKGEGENGAWTWFYEIRGCPVEIVRASGTTSVIVPPLVIDGDESQPWVLALWFRVELFKRFGVLASIAPITREPSQGGEVCVPAQPLPRLVRWSGSFARVVRSVWPRSG